MLVAQALEGPFSAVSKPFFAAEVSLNKIAAKKKGRSLQDDCCGAALCYNQSFHWAATKSFDVLKFKFKFPRARTFELFRARSRQLKTEVQGNLKIRWNYGDGWVAGWLADVASFRKCFGFEAKFCK